MKSIFQVFTATGHYCGLYTGETMPDALAAWATEGGYQTLAAALEVNPGARVRTVNEPMVEYRRVQHAAHQLGGAPGWDLEEWDARQEYDAPRPAEVPREANKSHGYIKDGAQVVVYTRRAPFTGTRCQMCDSHPSLKQ